MKEVNSEVDQMVMHFLSCEHSGYAHHINKKDLQRENKIVIDYIIRKYVFSLRIFKLLRTCSIRNQKNQTYLYKFVMIFKEHLGYGRFVSSFLIQLFSNNRPLLLGLLNKQNLNRFQLVNFGGRIVKNTLRNLGLFRINQGQTRESLMNFFILQLSKFESYSKPDILDFLCCLCQSDNQSIYINQDRIFRSLFHNPKNFRQLIQIKSADGKILLNFKGRDTNQPGEIESFFDLDSEIKNPVYMKEI
jgi:hypothetical protein